MLYWNGLILLKGNLKRNKLKKNGKKREKLRTEEGGVLWKRINGYDVLFAGAKLVIELEKIPF